MHGDAISPRQAMQLVLYYLYQGKPRGLITDKYSFVLTGGWGGGGGGGAFCDVVGLLFAPLKTKQQKRLNFD